MTSQQGSTPAHRVDNKKPNHRKGAIFMSRTIRACLAGVTLAALAWSSVAEAVPSFARQTGMPCQACHTSYPELTQFGRNFKLNGYQVVGSAQVEAAGDADKPPVKVNQIPPLSAMFQTAYEKLGRAMPDPVVPGINAQNATLEFPQQLSIFYAGEISPKGGAFVQLTYDHISDHITLDNTDIRFANQTTLGDREVVYGITANNGPSVEDLYQSTPIWGYPYTTSDTAVGGPTTLIDGNLGGDVAGVGVYTMVSGHLYANVSGYRAEHAGQAEPYDSTAVNTVDGMAPYWRLAYQTTMGDSFLEIGTYGIKVDMYPVGVTGPVDAYSDTAIDAQYERPIGANQLTVHATWISEKTDWKASSYSNASDDLDTFKIDGSYHIGGKQTWTLAYVSTSGKKDALRYTDSAAGSPDTDSWTVQYAYLPWQNVQVGAQYTAYTQFLGDSDNYDGAGRDAADNDATYLYAWIMW